MPSAFDAAWRNASPAIDQRFGSLFSYQPRMTPATGGRPIADPARPAMTITGALTEKPTFAFPETRSRRASVVAQEATQEMMIDIASDALPYDVANGDWLTSLDNGAIYEVNGPQPDGIARIELRVFKIKSGT